jgi:DNA-binding CsgD family transcriptional regulator
VHGISKFGNYFTKPRQLLPTYKSNIFLRYRHLIRTSEHAMPDYSTSLNTPVKGISHLPNAQRGYVGDKSSASPLPSGGIPCAGLPASGPPANELIASALDELACGVIIIDAQGRILHQNLAAYTVLARGDCVAIDDGTITATHAPDASQLADALAKAAQGKRSMIALGALSRTTVAVVPLRRQHAPANDSASPSPAARPDPQRFALMFSRAGVCESLMLSFFSRAHQLTASEETILGLMCAGLTAPEMAVQLKVAEATIRTHVRNICSKTHSSGIRDVVKRLAVLPPLMAAVMPSAMPVTNLFALSHQM